MGSRTLWPANKWQTLGTNPVWNLYDRPTSGNAQSEPAGSEHLRKHVPVLPRYEHAAGSVCDHVQYHAYNHTYSASLVDASAGLRHNPSAIEVWLGLKLYGAGALCHDLQPYRSGAHQQFSWLAYRVGLHSRIHHSFLKSGD
jgi:hypothetical protein